VPVLDIHHRSEIYRRRNSDRPWAVTIWTSGCISLIMPNTYLNRPEDDRPHRYSPRSGALTGTAGRLDS
jgi:hypothetical protein